MLDILSLLGISLHAVQDFYSHSNWVGFPTEKDDDSPYEVTTWLDLASQQPPPVRVTKVLTGIYPDVAGKGTTHNQLNKDNYTRGRWDRAYVSAYVATRQWIRASKAFVEEKKPGFWEQCVQGATVQGTTIAALRENLDSSYLLSEYLGRWKGGDMHLARAVLPFFTFRGQDSIFTNAFSERFIYAELSRDLGHKEIRRSLPVGMVPLMFSQLPLSENAIKLVIPTVKGRNNDDRMFAKIHMNGGGVTEEFTEDTQFGNSGDHVFPWEAILFVPKGTDEITASVALYNEGESSHDSDEQVPISSQATGTLTFTYRPSRSKCVLNGALVDCTRPRPLTSMGPTLPKAQITLFLERRELRRGP